MGRIVEGIKSWARERRNRIKEDWFPALLAAAIAIGVVIEIACLKLHY